MPKPQVSKSRYCMHLWRKEVFFHGGKLNYVLVGEGEVVAVTTG
jgi:hypothetical protein